MATLEDLVGVRVVASWKHDDDLYLVTDHGVFKLSPEGECCANCYVEHLSGSEALEDATVTRVENLENVTYNQDSCIVSDLWGHTIYTNKGRVSIEMRVNHNGYYGGQLDVTLLEPDPFGVIPSGSTPLEDF